MYQQSTAFRAWPLPATFPARDGVRPPGLILQGSFGCLAGLVTIRLALWVCSTTYGPTTSMRASGPGLPALKPSIQRGITAPLAHQTVCRTFQVDDKHLCPGWIPPGISG